MGRIYTASITASPQTTAVDLIEIVGTATKMVILHAWEIGQTTEFGDAQDETIGLLVKRGSSGSTAGSGGTTTTPAPVETGSAAASSTVRMMDTTQVVAGGGTLTTLMATSYNVRGVPVPWVPTPEMRFLFGPSERAVISITAPADSITYNATIWFEEIG
jgi:hypothetical protein